MSGPKVSSYELERQRQERLRREREERERQERLRREREREERRVQALVRKLEGMLDKARQSASRCAKCVSDLEGTHYDASPFRSYISKLRRFEEKYGTIASACGNGRSKEAACESALSQLEREGAEMVELIGAVHNTRMKDQRELAAKKIQEYRSRKENADKQQGTRFGQMAEEMKQKLSEVLSQISASMEDDAQVTAARQMMEKACSDYSAQPETLCNVLHQFQTGALQHLVEDARQEEYRRSIRIRYESLCAVAGVVPRNYDDSYAVTIERACGQLEKALDEYRSREYARSAIRECMQELGYNLMGERSDEAAQPTTQYLYRVAGTENVLRVTCSSDGQTVIEIGKGDRAQRTAEPREVDGLVKDMQDFCTGGFPAIRQKLMEKGVILKEQAWLPPVAECAQIIDMTPFLEEESECSLQAVYDQIVQRELLAAQLN